MICFIHDDRCHHSWAVVAPVKYENANQQISHVVIILKKYSENNKTEKSGLVTPTPVLSIMACWQGMEQCQLFPMDLSQVLKLSANNYATMIYQIWTRFGPIWTTATSLNHYKCLPECHNQKGQDLRIISWSINKTWSSRVFVEFLHSTVAAITRGDKLTPCQTPRPEDGLWPQGVSWWLEHGRMCQNLDIIKYVQTDSMGSGRHPSHITVLMQERRNFIANALELRLSCTNPLIWMFVPEHGMTLEHNGHYWSNERIRVNATWT